MTEIISTTLSATAAPFTPHLIDSSASSDCNSSSRATRTPQQNRSNDRKSAGRIDDVTHVERSTSIRESAPTRNDSRRKGTNVDRRGRGVTGAQQDDATISSGSQIPKANASDRNAHAGGNGSGSRRQRNQRKDVSGRTFPSLRTSPLSSAVEGDLQTADVKSARSYPQHSQHTKKTTSRASTRPTKFVPKVEEDRGLTEALTVGLTNSTYDCMVCWDVIRPAHKIWNCQVCWAAFHLDCLSTWAKKSSDESNNNGAGWRCPGCQNTQVSLPQEYNCFCGKVNEPDFNRYLTPHSCGELCGRSRDCAHPCNLPCHPGPCPPCSGLGPIQSCHCGNETFQLRCVDTDFTFQTGKSCDQDCGELLGCGKHTCMSVCHPGLCSPCEEEQEQTCYCGKHERKARCGDGEPRMTLVHGKEQTGFYECQEICQRPLDCGHHECMKKCHPLDDNPGQCPDRPEVVSTCPCGAKSVEYLLLGKTRGSCTDPIPVCGGLCSKILNCGHRCMEKCHRGECSPCKMTISIDCRCGSTHVQRACSNLTLYGDKQPTCEKPCRGLRSCGKHQCTNRCCPAKNQSKNALKGDPSAMEAHACTLVCGKKLQCGVHACEMLCHKGHCNPCLNASFDELSCSCGRTVLYPPIACGTAIPKCKYTCNRPRACGHASFSSHPCHPDSEPCPPCIMLVSKQCMCRKTKMPSVPCHMVHPSCGKVCGKRLDCGLHKCIKSCHSGECTLPLFDACAQPCPLPRKSCGHKCAAACHGQDPCPEDHPCQMLVISSCRCGNLTKEVSCQATAENPWDGKPRTIKCNDYCLVAERNRRVALALDIGDGVNRGPRIPNYDDYVLDYASANMEFTLKIEKRLADWVSDTSSQILNLPPMKGHHRKFVHELAGHYNVSSESVDIEPYRSVVIHKKLNTSVPDLLASKACRNKRPVSHAATGTGGVEQLRKLNIKDPINAVYLHDLVFGLTRNELSTQLAPVFGNIKYGIRWLTDDDAVLVPQPGNMSMDELELVLVHLRNGIKSLTTDGQLCERVELCWVNKEGEVVSHTSIGGGSQTKRFFNATQGTQLMKKAAPPKVENTFSLLDDDEKIAAKKRVEEDRILKAKAAAGTLSMEAWEEDEANASFSSSATSSKSLSRPKVPTVVGLDVDQNVVDDWQELLDDDDE